MVSTKRSERSVQAMRQITTMRDGGRDSLELMSNSDA
jgi:hypothetical protein